MTAGLWQQALQPFAQGVSGAITLAAASAMRRSLITLRSSGSGLSTSAGSDSRTLRCSLRSLRAKAGPTALRVTNRYSFGGTKVLK